MAAAGLLVAAWATARGALLVAPPVREAWSVIAVGLDTNVLLARLSVSDTGFYADQLTTRLFLLRQEGETVEHRATWGPTSLGDEGVASGPDRLARHPGGWELRLGGDAVQVSAVVAGAEPSCPPEVGFLTGSLGLSPKGATTSFEGGELVKGPAVVVRTRARGRVEGSALYVLGNGASLAVDPLASCPAWAQVAGRAWAGPALPLPTGDRGAVQVGPWRVQWRATASEGASHGLDHVSLFERLAAIAVGWPAPTLRLVRVNVRVSGDGFDEQRTGLLLVRGASVE